MATTKVKFRASSVSGKQGTLFIQVIHKRVVRRVSTSYKLYPEEWDAKWQAVVVTKGTFAPRSRYLYAVRKALKSDVSRLQLIILALDHGRTAYRVEDVVKRYLKKEPSDDFLAFADQLIGKKREEGYRSLASKYQSPINSLNRFLKGRLLTFEEMDAELLLSYEAYLKKQRLCPNSTSFYMRNLRAIYNQAANQGLTPQNHPFARVYTGIAKTVKRAVNAEEVRRIKACQLPANSAAELSRGIFLFSFYTCGMSLVDLANLKKSDLNGDYLCYCRQKTGQRIQIHWEPCMQRLVDKYHQDDSPYFIPIIICPGQDEERQYQNKIHLINTHLKKIGEQLGLSMKLTSYVARHSWASIAKSQDVPVTAISEAMGHTSERTTRIYLKSFENSIVDCANQKVISAIT